MENNLFVKLNSDVRGVIKKFVDRCNEIYIYLAMLKKIVGDIKQHMFYQL